MIQKIARIFFSTLFCILLVAQPSWAINLSPGDRVELQATSSLGVPLHERPSPSLVGRTADGTIAEVVATANNQGWIEIELPSKPSSVTVIKDSADRYFLSMVCEVNLKILPTTDNNCGIDLGIIDFATFDNGKKVKAPKSLKTKLKQLRRLQKHLSRKQKGSKRREVARNKLAKLHAKITDIRTDFLHKLSTKVIKENQLIALEDLNVSGLVKNRKLSRAISDLGWRSFRTMLIAKGEMYGRDVRIINRWEATSQT